MRARTGLTVSSWVQKSDVSPLGASQEALGLARPEIQGQSCVAPDQPAGRAPSGLRCLGQEVLGWEAFAEFGVECFFCGKENKWASFSELIRNVLPESAQDVLSLPAGPLAFSIPLPWVGVEGWGPSSPEPFPEGLYALLPPFAFHPNWALSLLPIPIGLAFPWISSHVLESDSRSLNLTLGSSFAQPFMLTSQLCPQHRVFALESLGQALSGWSCPFQHRHRVLRDTRWWQELEGRVSLWPGDPDVGSRSRSLATRGLRW